MIAKLTACTHLSYEFQHRQDVTVLFNPRRIVCYTYKAYLPISCYQQNVDKQLISLALY